MYVCYSHTRIKSREKIETARPLAKGKVQYNCADLVFINVNFKLLLLFIAIKFNIWAQILASQLKITEL